MQVCEQFKSAMDRLDGVCPSFTFLAFTSFNHSFAPFLLPPPLSQPLFSRPLSLSFIVPLLLASPPLLSLPCPSSCLAFMSNVSHSRSSSPSVSCDSARHQKGGGGGHNVCSQQEPKLDLHVSYINRGSAPKACIFSLYVCMQLLQIFV